MAKPGGKKERSLTQLAASLDTRKRPLPPELQVSAAEARALLRAGKSVTAKSAPASSGSVGSKSRTEALSSLAGRARPKTPIHDPKPEAGRRTQIQVRLAPVDRPDKRIEAAVAATQVSVGGLFLRTKAALKLGTTLSATLLFPPQRQEVRVVGEVVGVERVASGEPGFALRFTEYLDGAEAALVDRLLSPTLEEFVTAHAEAHGFEASPEYVSHTVDVLAAWELQRAGRSGDAWALTEE
jgi:hypothetical protein